VLITAVHRIPHYSVVLWFSPVINMAVVGSCCFFSYKWYVWLYLTKLLILPSDFYMLAVFHVKHRKLPLPFVVIRALFLLFRFDFVHYWPWKSPQSLALDSKGLKTMKVLVVGYISEFWCCLMMQCDRWSGWLCSATAPILAYFCWNALCWKRPVFLYKSDCRLTLCWSSSHTHELDGIYEINNMSRTLVCSFYRTFPPVWTPDGLLWYH